MRRSRGPPSAWRKCPQGIYLRPRFYLYSQAPRRVMALLACVREVHEELVSEGHWCRTLTVKLRYAGVAYFRLTREGA